jgi:hypothetical protein
MQSGGSYVYTPLVKLGQQSKYLPHRMTTQGSQPQTAREPNRHTKIYG